MARVFTKVAAAAALAVTGVAGLMSPAHAAIYLPDDTWMSGFNDQCLTASYNVVYLSECNTGSLAQHWAVESSRPDNAEGVPMAQIQSLYNFRCVDVEYDSDFKGYTALMRPCDHTNDNQIWAVTKPGGYQFFNFRTYTCIDMSTALHVRKATGCNTTDQAQTFY